MKTLCDMAIQRGPFVDQSQSFNVFVSLKEAPSHNERGEELSHAEKLAFNNEATKEAKVRLGKQQFHAWKGGLKTGSYYMKTKSMASAMVVSNTQPTNQSSTQPTIQADQALQQALASTTIEEDACAMCGS
jgi:ribonucleoside-diphosphate reductase subunit M1